MKKTISPNATRAPRASKPKKRTKLVVANWKMNPTSSARANEIFAGIKKAASRLSRTKAVVCPPYLYVAELARKKGALSVGVQDAYWERSGSYTGEVSAEMAAEAGAEYAIIGHSERRAMGETDSVVAKKLAAAIEAGLVPILCVGESSRDAEGAFLDRIARSLEDSLAGVSKKDFAKVVIAYEPVWAIGRSDDEAMTGKDLHETNLFVRKVLAGLYGKDAAFDAPLLYGGSVSWRNAKDLVGEGQADGLLVGRQSLEPEGYAEVLKIVDSI